MRKMKDSGVQWIGEIPEDWEVKKLKFIANIQTGNTPSKGTADNYADDGILWVKPDNLNEFNAITETSETLSETGAKIARVAKPNATLVCCIGSVGKLGYSEQTVAYNQQINAVEFDNTQYHWKYGMYYLSTQKEQHQYYMNGNVVYILNSESHKNILAPYLSYTEQQRIADYLDKKCSEIDSVIKAKEETNEKLKQYRQSVIFEAVTKGLDKNAKMKDSGIEWIGEIPDDWEVSRIKHTSTLKGRIGWQGLKADEFIDEGSFLITGTNFQNEKINWETCVHISQERFDQAPDIQIVEGDLLITKDGTVGKVAIAENCPQHTSLNSGVLLIRQQDNKVYINKFLLYVLLSDVFWKWFKISQNGNSTIIHLYQEQFSNFRFPYPKSITEQQRISDYLDKKCTAIDSVIKVNEQTIDKLKEYRQSVIYEAVTGKVEI